MRTELVDPTLPTVVLLFGGQSGEHQISCATAGGVLRAINPEQWNVVPVGIAPTGQWVPMPNDPEVYDLAADGGYTVEVGQRRVGFIPGSPMMLEYQVSEGEAPVDGTVTTIGKVDVVFPLLHGPFGEDGTVQGLLEFSHVNYVGCGVASSAVCQDKHLTKTVLDHAGIDVGKWVSFSKDQWEDRTRDFEDQIAKLGYPVFVKPCRAGSSLGVSRVSSPTDLLAAVEEAQRHDPRVIVEAAVVGREVECGVLVTADGEVHTSAVGEIRVLGDDFYDYETKYFDSEAVALDCPANLPEGVTERIQREAERAFRALEGEGISRVDFFYNNETGRLVLNEVNTMPGFTPFSMYPVMFQEAGLAYNELVNALLQEAASRPAGLR